MRILLLNPEYPPVGGGAGNASRHLAAAFARAGHDVTVLTAHYGDLPRHEENDGVKVKRISALRRRPDRSGAVEQAAFLLSGLWHTARQMRRERPDVVLAFFGAPSGIIAWLLRPFWRVPYVVALRGGDVPGFRPYDFALYHRIIGPVLHRVWRRAAAVVANSEGLRALARRFDARVPIRVIPNGVDASRFSPPSQRAWAPPHLLFVGRVVYQKGLDVLLQALVMVPDPPLWHLTIAGDGPHRLALEALVSRLGLQKYVTFAGWQPPERIPDFYRRANLFVFPSRDEGMPNAVLEAMASGLPVIATCIAGNEELITPEVGVLTPKDDPRSLAEALDVLLRDAALRQRMGEAARQRALEHFTWEATARQYLTLFREVL